MSRVSHGRDLTVPILQPGSTRFRGTASGFDVGERTFIVDTAHFVPPVRDTADNKLTWTDALGTKISGTHKKMFVDEYDTTELTGGRTQYVVRFLGLIGASKPDDVREDTELGQFRTKTNRTIPTVGTPVLFTAFEHVPTVSHVWIAKSKPSQADVGTKKNPPGDIPGAFVGRLTYYVTIRRDTDIIFEGWVLRSRSSKRAGTLWEVRDVYAYERVRKDS